MAIIGALGSITFEVSVNTIKTLDNMSWDSSVNYAEQDRYGDYPVPEFVGKNLDEISFDVKFSAYHGVNPIREYAKLLTLMREGTTMPLVIGEKAYGVYRWVITRLRAGLKQIDNKGRVVEINATISLKMYPQR